MEKIIKKIDKWIKVIKRIGEKIYQYRYYIAIIIFVLCIIFEISGSSIGSWKEFIDAGNVDDGVIWGESRAIRSDEWAVLTPMTFSQKFDAFHYFSNLIRGGNTDVFIVYGLPILNFVQIFRPFQIGFLFLGMAKGLSFFWCGRWIALFMVTFELAMLITKKKKLLSFTTAIMVTLAPIVQWWFAVNGVVEIFVFGELAILLLYNYMNTDRFLKRCFYLLGMVICAGGYLLVMYPAWQVPMAYVFLALAISVIIKNRKNCKMNYKDLIAILIAILIFGCSMGYIFHNSWDTVKAVMGTEYPGSRTETGGNETSRFYQYAINAFFPTQQDGIATNVCEESTMFTLFPIGLILAGIAIFKEKKKDVILIALLIVYAFLSIWTIVGFPKIIAKLTLMSSSPASRSVIALGFAEILILIRSLAILKKPVNKMIAIMISLVSVSVILGYCKNWSLAYMTTKMSIEIMIMGTYLFYFLLRYRAKYAEGLFTCGIVLVMITAGWKVNPIRTGTAIIYDSEIIQKVQEIEQQEKGKWIVEELGFPTTNYILMAGVPVINSTNTYPDLEKWRQFDDREEYEKVYNRYAHIGIKIRKNHQEYDKKFVLNGPDNFDVYLVPEELEKLDVKYVFTVNDLEEFNTEEITFEKIYEYREYKIYSVK